MKSTSHYFDRRLIFLGDSIFNCTGIDPVVLGNHYIPVSVYNNVRTNRNLSFQSYASSSHTLHRLSSSFSTYGNVINEKAIVVINAGTNDLGTSLRTAAQACNDLLYICGRIRSKGAISVVCTLPARNKAGDPADIETQRTNYNTLVRNSSASIDVVCDVGADTMFDTQSDCDNTANYHTDKLHMDFSGSVRQVSLVTTSVTSALNL